MKLSKELTNIRKKWYSNKIVQFNLLKAMRDREVIFMSKSENHHCLRGFFIRNDTFLEKIFDIYNIYENDYNIYLSVAKYSEIPMFNLDMRIRSKETSKWFEEKAKESIVEYDLLLDFDLDIKKIFLIKNNLLRIFHLLNFEEIMFNTYPSGTGFQLNAKSNLPIEIIKDVTKTIGERFNLKTLCTKGIGTISKIRKCEYSLVNDNVVLPFESEKTILSYNPNLYSANTILAKTLLFNRELCFFNPYKKQITFEFIKKYKLLNEEKKNVI